jgi:hypothetical protein
MKTSMLVCCWLAFFLVFPSRVHPEENKREDAASADKLLTPPAPSEQEFREHVNSAVSAVDSAKNENEKSNEKSETGFVNSNKFGLSGKSRLVPETNFSVQVFDKNFKDGIIAVYLHADKRIQFEPTGISEIEKSSDLGHLLKLKAYFKQDSAIGVNEISVCMPKWQPELKKLIKPKYFTGCFRSHPATLDIVYYADAERKKTAVDSFAVEIPEPFWAWIWGIAAIIISTWIAGMALNTKSGKTGRIPFFKVPLLLTETPTNRYSLSLTQLIIWTYITLFGLAFVWKMTQSFMEITPQVLMLLGIGGGTAAFTRLQAASRLQDIPYRFHKLLQCEDAPRKPKLADIISTGDGRPNLIKYQLITFTILIACIVFFEIVNKFAFPNLSDGLIALMGLSSAVYIGNDLSKNISEQDLQDKLNEMDEYLKGRKEDEIKALIENQDQKLIDFKGLIEKYLT